MGSAKGVVGNNINNININNINIASQTSKFA
jgi:hypothetical protein